jgi:hypothetical protein
MNKISRLMIGTLTILAVLTGFSFMSGQDKPAESVWAAQPPKIDGASKDWEGTTFSAWEKGGVQYAFRNDGNNLYLLFTITEPKLRSTIEELGLTVYVDLTGQESKDYGILFRRKRITANESIALLEKQGPVSDEQKEKMRATPFYNYYFTEVVNKKGEAVPVPPGIAGPPAMFKYTTEKKNLVYELMIPLSRINPALPGLGAGPGSTLSLGFEWGGPTEEQRKALARARGAQSNISNETDVGRSTDITAGARNIDRMPVKHTFWSIINLAKTE